MTSPDQALTRSSIRKSSVSIDLICLSIDPDGLLPYNGAIDDKPSARPSSLEGAHNYIDAAMSSLMNGEEVDLKTNTPYG